MDTRKRSYGAATAAFIKQVGIAVGLFLYKILEFVLSVLIGLPAKLIAGLILIFSYGCKLYADRKTWNLKVDPQKIKCPACGHAGNGTITCIEVAGPEKLALEYYCPVCSAKSYQAVLQPATKWYSPPVQRPQSGGSR